MRYLENDYELLYLVQENCEEALEYLFRKYDNLIKMRIKAFKIKKKNYDDFYQEGLLALDKAIKTYDDRFGKSFNKYFDLILQRRFIQILRNEQKYVYDTMYVEDFYEIIEEPKVLYNLEYEEVLQNVEQNLSDFEKKVFECRVKKNLSSKETAQLLNCSIRQVYNAMLRIRQKVK
ncbi:MAG: sigma-70 family RNA polymerase sigma factor [Acholeplasmataceae bacterium]|nr:sigma-70 family RNA polymerase sigma factor [Acholeplasmataceae bacterium]HPT89088.1 sigma-70 family RNA polymerase sigma factor [Bacilli bacterium]HQA20167.1 sigma-70 family RNA polymerase sigma factor [Bacilli bacterium]HQD92807.1 sigma-70 family RNA polymerase sigma factor [Bacilli bacterium]